MGAGHKEQITTASDVMSGLRLSLSRRRTIELGLAVGMAFSAPGVQAAEEPPEVFFSPEVSADALIRIYEKLSGDLSGRVGIKIHGGEAAVNLPLFRALQAHIPGSRFVETNWASDFGGSRRHTATHIAEIRSQGVDFAPVDVLDRAERPEDYVKLPIPGGANLKEIEVCRAMLEDYGGIVVLTNFKIPSFAGYTGAVKNIGIGLASPDGKAAVHEPGYQRSEAFFTNLADAAKGIKARMGRKMIAISILSNIHAEPFGGAAPKTGNLGIVGSFDPVAADQAACDLIWQLPSHTAQRQSIGQKIDSGWLQLEKLAAVGAGSRIYHSIIERLYDKILPKEKSSNWQQLLNTLGRNGLISVIRWMHCIRDVSIGLILM